MNGLFSPQIKFLSLKIQHRNIHLAGKKLDSKSCKIDLKKLVILIWVGVGGGTVVFFRLDYY